MARENPDRRAPQKARKTPKASPSEPPRANARRDLVEGRIFEEAARLFSERGFASTNLQDVADALGMTRPALYYYVRSKDDLLSRLVMETTEAPAVEIQTISDDTAMSPTSKLRAIAHAVALRRAMEPVRFKLLVRSESELPDTVAESNRVAQRATLHAFTKLIKDGVSSGEFRPVDPRVTALAVLGMCNWIAWWHHPHEATSAPELADVMADLAVAMVRQPTDRLLDSPGPEAAIALLRADIDYLETILPTDPAQ